MTTNPPSFLNFLPDDLKTELHHFTDCDILPYDEKTLRNLLSNYSSSSSLTFEELYENNYFLITSFPSYDVLSNTTKNREEFYKLLIKEGCEIEKILRLSGCFNLECIKNLLETIEVNQSGARRLKNAITKINILYNPDNFFDLPQTHIETSDPIPNFILLKIVLGYIRIIEKIVLLNFDILFSKYSDIIVYFLSYAPLDREDLGVNSIIYLHFFEKIMNNIKFRETFIKNYLSLLESSPYPLNNFFSPKFYSDGKYPLKKFIQEKNVEWINYFLKYGRFSRSDLYYYINKAIQTKNIAIIKLLLTGEELPLNILSNDKLLFSAIETGITEILDLFFPLLISVEIKGYDVLKSAISSQNIEMIKKIFLLFQDNIRKFFGYSTIPYNEFVFIVNNYCLSYAALTGNSEIYSFILSFGENLLFPGSVEKFPDPQLVYNNINSIYEIYGNKNIVNTVSLLLFAFKGGNIKIIDDIFERIKLKNIELIRILIHKNTPEVKKLLENNEKRNIIDFIYDLEVKIYITRSDKNLIEAIYYFNKIPESFKRDYSETIITYNGRKIFEYISNLDIDYSPDEEIINGVTNLMNTALYGSRYKLALMAKKAKNIDFQDSNGNTALMYAISSGNANHIKILLEKGADPLIEDQLGKSAYSYMMASLDENVRKSGYDIFVASTQEEGINRAPGTFSAKRAERHFYGTESAEGSRKSRFQDYLNECEVENNFERVLQISQILGISPDKIEGKSQTEICKIIKRLIEILSG